MNTSQAIDSLQSCIQRLIHQIQPEIEHLNANNLSLAILALLAYNRTVASKLVDSLYSSLLKKQLVNGSWLDELWPTALALLSIHEYAQRVGRRFSHQTPFIRRALEYIKATQCRERLNWQGEFLETILLGWVFLKIRHEPEYEFVRQALERLKAVQTDEGYLFDIYDTSMAVCAFDAGQQTGMDNKSAIDKALLWLKRWNPNCESVWNRSVLLFMLAETGIPEREWGTNILLSLHGDVHQGVISDDCDEQAMAILASSAFLARWCPNDFESQRVPADNLLHVVNYREFIKDYRTRLDRRIEAINFASAEEKIFKYTDQFIGNWDRLFTGIDGFDQFRSMISAFYMVFYEATGSAKRLPASLKDSDSVVFKIKHLRTSVDHDFQHGDSAAIEKKTRLIERIYMQYCGKSRPSEIDELRLVQVALLAEVQAFLDRFLELLQSRKPSS